MFTSSLLALLLPALVSAHGYVNKITIDGTVYQGNSVGTTPTTSSVIRQIDTNSPVKGATNPDLNCGTGATLAADVANANPGSTVRVYWAGGTTGTSSWPHNVGPIMHYMALCDGSCANYNSSGAKWFKIMEQGLQPGSTNWYQAQLQSGSPATVTIPSNLAPGNYMLRSEIITLQLAMTEGGAEFYPSCMQLSVGGSQTGQPSSSDEVTFPGGYSDTDPGILVDVYDSLSNYTFPGPPVASFISGGSSSESSTGSGSSSASAVPSPSAAPSSAPSPSVPAAPSSPVVPSSAPSPSSSEPADPCPPVVPSSSPSIPAAPSSPVVPTSVPSPSNPAEPCPPVAPSSVPLPSPSEPAEPCPSVALSSPPSVPSNPVAPSAPAPPSSVPLAPSSPVNVGGSAPTSVVLLAPSPSSTGGSGSGCMRKRMHKRRYPPSH